MFVCLSACACLCSLVCLPSLVCRPWFFCLPLLVCLHLLACIPWYVLSKCLCLSIWSCLSTLVCLPSVAYAPGFFLFTFAPLLISVCILLRNCLVSLLVFICFLLSDYLHSFGLPRHSSVDVCEHNFPAPSCPTTMSIYLSLSVSQVFFCLPVLICLLLLVCLLLSDFHPRHVRLLVLICLPVHVYLSHYRFLPAQSLSFCIFLCHLQITLPSHPPRDPLWDGRWDWRSEFVRWLCWSGCWPWSVWGDGSDGMKLYSWDGVKEQRCNVSYCTLFVIKRMSLFSFSSLFFVAEVTPVWHKRTRPASPCVVCSETQTTPTDS